MASVHPRGKKGIYHACMHVGAPEPKWQSTGLTDKRDAQRWADKEEARLKNQYAIEHPGVSPAPGGNQGTTPSSQPAQPPDEIQTERPFLERLNEVRDKLAKDGAWATSNLRQHTTVINLMARAMGERINAITSRLDEDDFLPVKNMLKLDGNKIKGSGNYVGCIRRLLRPLIGNGLQKECLDVFKDLKAKGRKKASGRPFRSHEIQIMIQGLVQEEDWVSGFVFGGLSGGPHVVDLLFLKWTEAKLESRRIVHERFKTGVESEYQMLPMFYEWLQRRPREEGDIYVFPELVFTKVERKQLGCNKRPVNEDARVETTSGNTTTNFSHALERWGIKEKGLSFKSFRQFAISFWSSVGIRTTTRMRMAGHIEMGSHMRYDFPADWEIRRAGDLTNQYVQSIIAGKQMDYPATLYEVHERIMARLDRLQSDTVQSFRDTFLREMLLVLKHELESGLKRTIQVAVAETMRSEFAAFKAELWRGLPYLLRSSWRQGFHPNPTVFAGVMPVMGDISTDIEKI